MSETIDEKLRSRAKRAGASLLAFKPGLSKLDPLQYDADLRAFGDKLARDLLPRLEGRRDATRGSKGPSAPPAPADTGAAARESLVRSAIAGARRAPRPRPDRLPAAAHRARVPAARRAAAGARRAAARPGRIRPGRQRHQPRPARPRPAGAAGAASPFSEAVAFGRTWSGPLPADGPLRSLVERLGRLAVAEAAVFPCAPTTRRSRSSTATHREADGCRTSRRSSASPKRRAARSTRPSSRAAPRHRSPAKIRGFHAERAARRPKPALRAARGPAASCS